MQWQKAERGLVVFNLFGPFHANDGEEKVFSVFFFHGKVIRTAYLL